MGMPTLEELNEALTEAARMREQGDDPHHVGKALLNLHYRTRLLEDVLHAAERFLHSGMAAQEHQQLQRAIERVRSAVDRTAAVERDQFGLE